MLRLLSQWGLLEGGAPTHLIDLLLAKLAVRATSPALWNITQGSR
jgi:hypothetical protein